MKYIGSIIFTICICLIITPVISFGGGPGTSGSSYLKINIGARPIAMGGAFCAVSDDVNAIQWNPAGLSQIKGQEIIFAYSEWISGVKNNFIGYASPAGKAWFLGLALNYWLIEGLTGRDISGNETNQTFAGNSNVTILALGKKLRDDFSVGFCYKKIQESIYNNSAASDGLDIGFLYRLRYLRIGAAIQNLGAGIKLYEESFPLPLNLKYGLSLKILDKMVIALDQNMPADNDSYINLGFELKYGDANILRAGYKISENEDKVPGFSFGLAFSFRNYNLDYSFQPFGDLGDTHRISLLYTPAANSPAPVTAGR
jgi:hypothetical protein